MYSKYERRTDTRTYEDRRKLYEGVSDLAPPPFAPGPTLFRDVDQGQGVFFPHPLLKNAFVIFLLLLA